MNSNLPWAAFTWDGKRFQQLFIFFKVHYQNRCHFNLLLILTELPTWLEENVSDHTKWNDSKLIFNNHIKSLLHQPLYISVSVSLTVWCIMVTDTPASSFPSCLAFNLFTSEPLLIMTDRKAGIKWVSRNDFFCIFFCDVWDQAACVWGFQPHLCLTHNVDITLTIMRQINSELTGCQSRQERIGVLFFYPRILWKNPLRVLNEARVSEQELWIKSSIQFLWNKEQVKSCLCIPRGISSTGDTQLPWNKSKNWIIWIWLIMLWIYC